ncbi:MAG: hypothetical protein IKT55_07970 [Clostridia bacterium]|nr:hypothetical protein [Clostridia bacterium]
MKNNLAKIHNSPFVKKPFGGLSGNFLKLLAIAFMILDHTRMALVEGNMWMNYVGRMAFPVFAFQISEGFVHTRSFGKYLSRLLIFAVISEIPFNVFCSSEIFFPQYQNVLFTFVLGILALRLLDFAKKEPTLAKTAGAGIGVVAIVFLAEVLKLDYGAAGVILVVAFYLFRNFPFAFILQFATMFLLFVFFYPGRPIYFKISDVIFHIPVQAFALFSFIPIWLYNGKKGRGGKTLQYATYGFYPVHIAVLCVVRYVLKNVV